MQQLRIASPLRELSDVQNWSQNTWCPSIMCIQQKLCAPASALYHPAGLSKYGWEAHDGRSFGRQESHDKPFQLTISWVKQQCPDCGYGGDWAILLDAKQHADSARSSKPDTLGTNPKTQRVSAMFYMADERHLPISIDVPEQKQPSTKGNSRSVFRAGDTNGEAWQVHAQSTSELAAVRCDVLPRGSYAGHHYCTLINCLHLCILKTASQTKRKCYLTSCTFTATSSHPPH